MCGPFLLCFQWLHLVTLIPPLPSFCCRDRVTVTSTLFWKRSQAESLAARLKKLAVIPTKKVKSKDQLIPLVDTTQVRRVGERGGECEAWCVHGFRSHCLPFECTGESGLVRDGRLDRAQGRLMSLQLEWLLACSTRSLLAPPLSFPALPSLPRPSLTLMS